MPFISKMLQRPLLFSHNFCSQAFLSFNQDVKKDEIAAERLKGRSILAISGPDAESFLQELTTNDMRQLEIGPCMFTLFLNGRGRVIHDAIIYKDPMKGCFYVECDILSIQALQVHMIMYRARKEVEIKSVEHELIPWAVYNPREAEQFINSFHSDDFDYYRENEPSILDEINLGNNIPSSRDPRMWPLGLRLLAPKDLDVIGAVRRLGLKVKAIPALYKSIRYKLGVGEGTAEVGYGRCLPAEVNGDFLNGIDENKANYIGYFPETKKQSVDTRLMPIMLNGINFVNSEIPVNTPIEDARGRKKAPVGYLRGLQGTLGLGLMNVTGALQYKNVKIGKTLMQVVKPPWWRQ